MKLTQKKLAYLLALAVLLTAGIVVLVSELSGGTRSHSRSATIAGPGRPKTLESTPVPESASVPAPTPRTPGEALNSGIVDQMIQVLRTAALANDAGTRKAMTIGLTKHGETARRALQSALARETQPAAVRAFNEALEAVGRTP